MSNKHLHVLDDSIKESILNLAAKGAQKGIPTGFNELNEIYTLKEGSTTYVVASPHSGKTQFAVEIMVNTAEYSDWNWLVYSPETGSPADVFSELMWAYLKKPIVKNDKVPYASPAELERAFDYVRKHFFIIDGGIQSTTVQDVYRVCDDLLEMGKKIDGVLIDPFTEIDMGANDSGRDDIQLGNTLTLIRKYSSDHGIHTMVTVHTKFQQPMMGKSVLDPTKKIVYYPKADYNSIAGGQMWSRKAMMIITLWRCPYGMADDNGVPYEKNQVEVSVIKAKPKAVGKIGSMFLFYDYIKNRYYTEDENGNKQYAKETDEQARVPVSKQTELPITPEDVPEF